jgi:thymidylate synthase (FAD)
MTKVTELWITPNALDVVAYCARVSNPGNQANKKTAPKLLSYLKKHKHWSPFEMASMCVEIETTRDIAHQIVRHRSFSFQEFSQRYANVDDLGSSVTYREARMQDPNNRQNSVRAEDGPLHAQWRVKQENTYEAAKTAYKWAIDNGIAKEQARAVLPEGMTDTRLYMSGTIRSWIHYVELREANGTQKEHQEIALQVREILTQHGFYKASYEI